eukprot:4981135-Amphidinium_carterae.2
MVRCQDQLFKGCGIRVLSYQSTIVFHVDYFHFLYFFSIRLVDDKQLGQLGGQIRRHRCCQTLLKLESFGD